MVEKEYLISKKSAMFEEYVQYIYQQEKRVKTNQLPDNELAKLVNVVDLKVILTHQKLSLQFIKQHILPLIDKENKLDPTRSITLDKIKEWQNIKDLNCLLK